MKAKLNGFVGKTCKSGAAFEFVPKKPQNIDLEKFKGVLVKKGIKPEAVTSLVIVFRLKDCTVSLFKSGKILVKGKKEAEAKKVAEKIIGLC